MNSELINKTGFPTDPNEKNPEYIQNYLKECGEDFYSSCPNWIPPKALASNEEKEVGSLAQRGLELFNPERLSGRCEKRILEHCPNRY